MNIRNSIFDLPQAQQILCVFAPLNIHPRWETFIAGRPIQECDWASLSAIKKALLWVSYGQFHRDNPRSPRYMSDLALEWISRGAPQAHWDVLASDALREGFSPEFSRKIQRVISLKEISARSYDAILLFYPDAIGTGWGALETSLSALNASAMWVVNGRRRVFPWTPVFRRKLAWRRALEKTWLVEAVFVLMLLPASLVLAIVQFPRRLIHHGR